MMIGRGQARRRFLCNSGGPSALPEARVMKLLFVADPLEQFKTDKDSTFAMMREAASRGHELLACEPRHLVWERDGRVSARMRDIALTGDADDWFAERAVPVLAL